MPTPTGGLRDRLIHESLFQALKTELTTLGWFDSGREHLPITLIDEYPDENEEVAFNTMTFSMGDGGGNDSEIGANSEDFEMVIFVDFFAEGDSIGRHVRGDVYEFFRTNRILPVYDYSSVGTPQEFEVEVQDDIDMRKPDRAVNKWQKHWYVVSFTVVDYLRPHV